MAKKITKSELTKFLRTKLSTDKTWAVAALVRIFDNQTLTEQNSHDTINDNGIGFTVGDAKLLTSFAKFYRNRGFLTERQMAFVLPKMGKYAAQLMKMEYFKMEKLEAAYAKYVVA